ncbi:hypothetical protein [Paracraurococcus lichenis]|uniref:Uncharacterized protein n=1 Tax=Paracraurococcus lichenis TaxID=3064888 RepID=A0ABT9E706_9PROT|nr:hypothetical protein [Paracraurococcus sp. LOR1-02]MDO9711939.1 hypothetical protein [Paracraurococcus sp. LOR1-02]
MSDSSSDPGARPEQLRLDAVRCPHCDEVTMPNQMADGSVVCSCTAERALPLDLVRGSDWDGERGSMPPPVDEPMGPKGAPAHGMPPGEDQKAQAPRRGPLPEDKGQFGRDVETEGYEPLRPPPRD